MSDTGWQAEIEELHDFFQRWLGGDLPNTRAAYARLEHALAPEFALISPDGTLQLRDQLLEQLRHAHGSRPGWRMWIERPQLRFRQTGLAVATYEEWQRHANSTMTARLSTVVFRDQLGTPNGLTWLHVHETWLPDEMVRAKEDA
jgi:hypothetical protein